MIDNKHGVKLGSIDLSMAYQLRQWRNHILIRKWCRQTSLISDQDQENWMKLQNEDKTVKMFSIFSDTSFADNPSKELLIGCCGLTSIDHINQRAEFSVYIGPEYHGNGFGKKTLLTLFWHAFEDLNLNTIWGECFNKNPANKLFKDLGMTQEGIRRQFYFKEGEFIDAHLYSITKEEFFHGC